MKKVKYFVSTFIFMFSLSVNAENVASGSCGTNARWNLDSAGILTIQGNGPISDFYYETKSPWHSLSAQIKEIRINEGITAIGNYAFENCSNATIITLPSTITSLGIRAFYYCSSIKSIELPNSITNIGSRAFYHCSSLTSIVLPRALKTIGEDAFTSCTNLTIVDLPETLERIDGYAFYRCTSLTSLVIPNSVKSIGTCAFADCTNLQSVNIPTSVNEVGGKLFVGCKSISSPIYNETTFFYMPPKYSGEYTISEGILKINENAFENCKELIKVTIPSTVAYIQPYAFYGCDQLKRVENRSLTPQYITSNTFSQYETLIVPEESINTYHNASYWKKFSIVDQVYFPGDVDGDGKITTADVKDIADYLLGKQVQYFSVDAADVNQDGIISIFDVSYVISLLK